MQCAGCAAELPSGSRFCLSCGQAVGAPSRMHDARAW
jgi:rRNA maturation endonuclease Nob1